MPTATISVRIEPPPAEADCPTISKLDYESGRFQVRVRVAPPVPKRSLKVLLENYRVGAVAARDV